MRGGVEDGSRREGAVCASLRVFPQPTRRESPGAGCAGRARSRSCRFPAFSVRDRIVDRFHRRSIASSFDLAGGRCAPSPCDRASCGPRPSRLPVAVRVDASGEVGHRAGRCDRPPIGGGVARCRLGGTSAKPRHGRVVFSENRSAARRFALEMRDDAQPDRRVDRRVDRLYDIAGLKAGSRLHPRPERLLKISEKETSPPSKRSRVVDSIGDRLLASA